SSVVACSIYDRPRRRHFLFFPTRRSSDLQTAWLKKEKHIRRLSRIIIKEWKLARLLIPHQPLSHRRAKADMYAPGVFASRDANTDRKSTRLNSSHVSISYAVFCLK